MRFFGRLACGSTPSEIQGCCWYVEWKAKPSVILSEAKRNEESPESFEILRSFRLWLDSLRMTMVAKEVVRGRQIFVILNELSVNPYLLLP